MKINTNLSGDARPANATNSTASKNGGQSFSEVLAAGTSIAAIRSERALGFAETGLLGARRSTGHRPATQLQKQMVEHPATAGTGSGSTKQSNYEQYLGIVKRGEQRTSNLGSTIDHKAIVQIRSKPFNRSSGFFDVTAPSRLNAKLLCERRMEAPPFARTAYACLQFRRRNRNGPSIQLRDDDGITNIQTNIAGITDEQRDELVTTFFAISRYFSVTLGEIKINGQKF
jgi:hypothetical protein